MACIRGRRSTAATWLARAVIIALLLAGPVRPARAQPAAAAGTGAESEKDKNDKKDEERPHTEFDPVPLIGGNTDIGWGGGALAEIVRHDTGYRPFRWSLEISGLVTFKLPTGGSVQLPYQDYYALLKLPHLLRDELSLEVRPSYSNEAALKYYGLGNASQVTPFPSQTDPYYEYGHIHPTLLVTGRLHLAGHFFALMANSFRYNILQVSQNTKLAQEQASGSQEVRHLLGADFANHAVDILEYAIVYDTRDSEIEPQSGFWHQASFRVSPGGVGTLMPYRYGQGDVTLRGYVTPIPKRLTLAGRVVADWQFGNVPFYELAAYEETYAIGGVQGVRGPPAQRYYGKEKIFFNLEARSTLVNFRLFGKSWGLGLAAFFRDTLQPK